VDGIDLSNHNAGFDGWAGVGFAWLKVTEATDFVDAEYAGFADAATAAGVPYGGYHFAHPDANTPDAEAHWFLDHVAPAGTLPAAVDIEPRGTNALHRDPLVIMGAQGLAQWIDQWCSIVAAATGVDPLMYVDRSYAAALAPFSHRWPLWLATLDGTQPATWAGRTVSVVQHAIADGVDQDHAFLLTTGGFLMALSDAQQEELHAWMQAMATQNWQAPGMDLAWFASQLDAGVERNLPKIVAAVVAALPPSGAPEAFAFTGEATPATGAPAATEAPVAPSEAPAPAPAVEPPTA
jgi:hypothetical protein